MLFRDYLSGSGQISVIAAVSPRACDAVGTLDTLRFAAIAQQVRRPRPRLPSTARAPAHPHLQATIPSCARGHHSPQVKVVETRKPAAPAAPALFRCASGKEAYAEKAAAASCKKPSMPPPASAAPTGAEPMEEASEFESQSSGSALEGPFPGQAEMLEAASAEATALREQVMYPHL